MHDRVQYVHMGPLSKWFQRFNIPPPHLFRISFSPNSAGAARLRRPAISVTWNHMKCARFQVFKSCSALQCHMKATQPHMVHSYMESKNQYRSHTKMYHERTMNVHWYLPTASPGLPASCCRRASTKGCAPCATTKARPGPGAAQRFQWPAVLKHLHVLHMRIYSWI